MQTFRERYVRYALFAVTAALGVTILIELGPFIGGIFGAATIYVLLRRQMHYLTQRRQWRRCLAASLLSGEAVLLFLIPVGLLIWLVVVKTQHLALHPQQLVAHLHHLADLIRLKTGYDLWNEEHATMIMDAIPRIGQAVAKGLMDLCVNLLVLIFVLYFMLIGGERMEAYIRELLPFDRPVSRRAMRQMYLVIRSNAIGIPLLALAQGAASYVGYLVFGVDGAWFWAVMTGCASVIPVVGTALIWVPLGIVLAFGGHWGVAIGLELYGVLVITQVDNFGRFLLQKYMADIHPLVTIFGVFIGISLFGFIGVVFGPLLLSMFDFCFGLFKNRYLDPSEPTSHADNAL